MKLVNTSLRVRKDPKSSFHHCGCPVKLRQGSLSVSKELHWTSTVVKGAFMVLPDIQTLVNELHRTSTVVTTDF